MGRSSTGSWPGCRSPKPTVREALAGLTFRGRAFLAAGVTTILCAVVVGQAPLIPVGVLLTVLPLLAAGWIGRSRYRLALTRTVSPRLVAAGQPSEVGLRLSNESRAPTGVLLLEDHVPYVLGTRPRFVLEGVGHGWRRQVTYQVRSEVRGHFDIGPMSVRVTDPFGLVELGRAFHTTASLTVTPRTVPLPGIPLGGVWTGAGDNRPRAFATGSAEDVTVREYRQGDDLRRVHWRSSARVGELMVRREEQPWQSRATVFLDNRLISHRGQGVASSLESAVSTAASIAVHLSQRGYAVRLVTASGEQQGTAWHSRSAGVNTAPLLETLAAVETAPSARLDTTWLSDEPGHGGLMVAVLGAVADYDGPFLKRVQHHAATCAAIALDVDEWAPLGAKVPAMSTAAALASTGWRAVTLRRTDHLEVVWQELGRLSSRQGVGS